VNVIDNTVAAHISASKVDAGAPYPFRPIPTRHLGFGHRRIGCRRIRGDKLGLVFPAPERSRSTR